MQGLSFYFQFLPPSLPGGVVNAVFPAPSLECSSSGFIIGLVLTYTKGLGIPLVWQRLRVEGEPHRDLILSLSLAPHVSCSPLLVNLLSESIMGVSRSVSMAEVKHFLSLCQRDA